MAERRKFFYGRQSGGGNANAVNFTSLEADFYLQGFGFNWITKQFKPHLAVNCYFCAFFNESTAAVVCC